MGQLRHQIARSFVAVDDRVRLAVHAPIDRVNQGIAAAHLRMLQERRRQHPFAGGRERDVDRIVHPAGHHRLDHGVAGTPAKDVRSACHQRRLARAFVGLLGERAFGPIDPAVGTEVGPVEVVRAVGQRLSLKPLFASIGHAVSIGIRQFPDARRRRDIQGPVKPHRAFGKHHLVGEDDARVEPAIAVPVFEPDDPMRLVSQLLFNVVVRS